MLFFHHDTARMLVDDHITELRRASARRRRSARRRPAEQAGRARRRA